MKFGLREIACLGVCLLPLMTACGDSAPYVDDAEDETELSSSPSESSDSQTDAETTDTVVLYGQFEEHLGGTLFALEPDEDVIVEGVTAESVLVVNDSDRSFAVPTAAGTPVWAIGEVRPLNLLEIDGIEPADFEAYEGQSAIYAERITLAPEPSELTENAESFYDQNVTVYGEVESVDAANTFILTDPELFEGRGVVVIQTGDTADEIIADDAKLAVTGVLRPYAIATLQEDYDLTWELDFVERVEAEYEEVPVLIADLITLTNDE